MATQKQPRRLVLDETLKTPGAQKLLSELKTWPEDALEIDASNVSFLGGACLQVLLSAAETWRARGERFRIIEPSDAFLNDAATLGAADLLGLTTGATT